MTTSASDPSNVVSIIASTEKTGLTKREYFAAAALQGILSGRGYADPSDAVTWAVAAADALVEELNQ